MNFIDVQTLVSFVTTKAKLPEWQTKLFKKYSSEIQVHSKGQIFYKIDRLFPNENPQSKDHRMLSFEPVTKASFHKGLTNIMRIFSNSSYTCEASEETNNLITDHVFDNKNLFSFFLEQWVMNALAYDPNSLIVVYPPDFIKDKSFSQVMFIKSEDIVHADNDTFIFKSEEESDVTYESETISVQNQFFYDTTLSVARLNMREAAVNSYNEKIKTKYIRTVYHAFTQNMFYRIEQDKTNSNEFDVTTYTLPGKTPPVAFAGGVKTDRVFESFLAPFVHFGNLALLQHSQHTAVNFIYSFPRMSEVQSACDFEECQNGVVTCDVTEDFPLGLKPCSRCNGTGYTSSQTPYKIYAKKYDPAGLTDDNKSILNAPSVEYYTPDVGILTYSKQEWRDYLEMAEMAIYVQQKVQTGNVESAKSKEIDLDELYAFLLRVSKTFYDRLRFVIQCFEGYTVKSPANVTVNIPFSFAILSEYDAFDALQKILTSNAPDMIKGEQIDSFILKFVSQSSPVKKAYEVLKLVDLLTLKNDSQIGALKSNGIVTPEQWLAHTFAYPILMQMYANDENIFEQKAAVVAEKLKKELSAFQPVDVTGLKTALQKKFNG